MKPNRRSRREIVSATLVGVCLLVSHTTEGAVSTERPAQVGPTVGDDLIPMFRRAHEGSPLRVVALGGSITQAGKGWVGDWLRSQFPKSDVFVTNAGMSATGSDLGIFRLERDVIAAQPDLVLIEFAVNDIGHPDEIILRSLESIVVRLKRMPFPPAVVFVEAAFKTGVDRSRHQRVAAHYRLLDIDLHEAVGKYLQSSGTSWETLFRDLAHPNNERGHPFYAKAIADCLRPFVDAARSREKVRPYVLPKPISAHPLLIDATMMPLSEQAGWEKETSLPDWWSMFFPGVISAKEPGASLRIPVRGTTIGVFYPMDELYSDFYASVDSGLPSVVETHNRVGYDYRILANGVAACEHTFTLAAPPETSADHPVKLGYVLLAGHTEASRELTKQGSYTPRAICALRFEPLVADRWCWIGPFGAPDPKANGILLHQSFAPEQRTLEHSGFRERFFGRNDAPLTWMPGKGPNGLLDFDKMAGIENRGVFYAATRVYVASAGQRVLRMTVDYYAKVWVNRKLVRTVDSGHGSGQAPLLLSVTFDTGWNTIFVKVDTGYSGCNLSVALERTGPATQRSPLDE